MKSAFFVICFVWCSLIIFLCEISRHEMKYDCRISYPQAIDISSKVKKLCEEKNGKK